MAKNCGINIREIPRDLLMRFKMLVLHYQCKTQGQLLQILVELGEKENEKKKRTK